MEISEYTARSLFRNNLKEFSHILSLEAIIVKSMMEFSRGVMQNQILFTSDEVQAKEIAKGSTEKLLKSVDTLLPVNYKVGFQEGIEKFLLSNTKNTK